MKPDEYGLLITDEGDGGDTARNEWSSFIAGRITSAPAIRLFRNDFSELVRHPDPRQWWSDTSQTSRDQALHAFTYLAAINKDAFNKFYAAHKKRYWRCQNGDVLWGSMNVVWRAAGWPLYRPLIAIMDIMLVIGVMERCHWLPRWNQDLNKLF